MFQKENKEEKERSIILFLNFEIMLKKKLMS
jgi:hypothetical protein